MKTKTATSPTALPPGLKRVIYEGMATQTMIILTSGTLLIALALKLGASHVQIGIITSIPLFSNVFQIASIYLVNRWKSRKKVVVVCTTLGRSAYLLIALLPFLSADQSAIFLIMIALVVQHGLGAVSNGGWSSWMRDLVPHATMGTFFSQRLTIVQSLSIFLSIGTVLLINYVTALGGDAEIYLYGALFLVGSLAGLIGSYFLSGTPEPNYEPSSASLLSAIRLPFAHVSFRKLMAYMASWNFAVNLAVPFFTVYLLETLGFSMAYVIGLTTLTQLFNVLFFRLWGRCADQFSNKTVLRICAPMYLLCVFCMVFTTWPEKHTFTLPLLIVLHAVMGIATAGTGLAASSIGLKLAPQAQSVAFLSVLSFTNSLASGLAPLLAGVLSSYLVDIHWTLVWNIPGVNVSATIVSMHHLDFLFLLAFLFGILSMMWLRQLQEVGETSRAIVLSKGWKDTRAKLFARRGEPKVSMAETP